MGILEKRITKLRKRSSSQYYMDINEFLEYQCGSCVDCKDTSDITKGGEFPERTTVISSRTNLSWNQYVRHILSDTCMSPSKQSILKLRIEMACRYEGQLQKYKF
jgi:hypothetical protein